MQNEEKHSFLHQFHVTKRDEKVDVVYLIKFPVE